MGGKEIFKELYSKRLNAPYRYVVVSADIL
jgi:hypothetical protein